MYNIKDPYWTTDLYTYEWGGREFEARALRASTSFSCVAEAPFRLKLPSAPSLSTASYRSKCFDFVWLVDMDYTASNTKYHRDAL